MLMPVFIVVSMVGSTIYFVWATITSMIQFYKSVIVSPFPGVRWGRYHAQALHRLTRECEYLLYRKQTVPGVYVELTRMAVYKIPCPPARNNLTYIGEWALFLAKLVAYADTHNLKAARQLWHDTKV